MESKKEEYEKVVSEKENILHEIENLEKTPQVQQYLNLSKRKEELINREKLLAKDLKNEKYSSCYHIFVKAHSSFDIIEGRGCALEGCIKCGLDEIVFSLEEYGWNFDDEKRLMYEYMNNNHSYLNIGIHTNIWCDLELGYAIYSKIKERYPDIDDETIVKYFKHALYDIKENKVSNDRKASRAKRLSLSPKFNKW